MARKFKVKASDKYKRGKKKSDLKYKRDPYNPNAPGAGRRKTQELRTKGTGFGKKGEPPNQVYTAGIMALMKKKKARKDATDLNKHIKRQQGKKPY